VVEVLYQKGVAALELVKVADIDLERERLVASLLSIVGLSLFLKTNTGGSDPVIVLHIKMKGSIGLSEVQGSLGMDSGGIKNWDADSLFRKNQR